MADRGLKIQAKPSLSKLDRRFKNANDKMSKLQLFHKQVAVFLDSWVLRNFKSEGGNVGKWKPFKMGGRRIPGGIDTSAKLLQDTGRLRASFVPFADAKNAGIGSDLEYSEFHEKGLGRLPMRRMLPKNADVKDDIVELAEDHIKFSLRELTR